MDQTKTLTPVMTKSVAAPSAGTQGEQKGKRGRGRPRTNFREITKAAQKGLQEGWTRATFIIREDHLEGLKAVAYWDRKKLKDIIDEAMGIYLSARKTATAGSGAVTLTLHRDEE